jgi:hypothetical protein
LAGFNVRHIDAVVERTPTDDPDRPVSIRVIATLEYTLFGTDEDEVTSEPGEGFDLDVIAEVDDNVTGGQHDLQPCDPPRDPLEVTFELDEPVIIEHCMEGAAPETWANGLVRVRLVDTFDSSFTDHFASLDVTDQGRN